MTDSITCDGPGCTKRRDRHAHAAGMSWLQLRTLPTRQLDFHDVECLHAWTWAQRPAAITMTIGPTPSSSEALAAAVERRMREAFPEPRPRWWKFGR